MWLAKGVWREEIMNKRGTKEEEVKKILKKEEVNNKKREREDTPENKGEWGKRINEIITQKSPNILQDRGTWHLIKDNYLWMDNETNGHSTSANTVIRVPTAIQSNLVTEDVTNILHYKVIYKYEWERIERIDES